MVNKGTIACFFTCGYTESGGMQGFLHRINPSYEYRMYLPNKVLRKKQMKAGKPVSMIKEEYSGLTGDALIHKILEILELRQQDFQTCCAILIEDDTDDRLHQLGKEGFLQNQKKIAQKIKDIMKREVPVLFLDAAPEIEGWFLADWKHTFEKVYLDDAVQGLSKNECGLYLHRLRKYIKEHVWEDIDMGIEDFYREDSFGRPVKLSDELISAVEHQAEKCFSDKDAGMLKGLRYAKSQEGITMLRSLDYTVLQKNCRRLFQQECRALKQLHD